MAQDVEATGLETPKLGVSAEGAAPFARPLLGTQAPPVMEARRWLDEVEIPANRPLLNVSQAAPTDPPPDALRRVMAAAVAEGGAAHLYGPVLGDPALRREIAARWSTAYGGAITDTDVAVTAGCNQAFCAAISTLAGPGDAVLLPAPWYFNHKMWLDMAGVRADPLPCDMTAGALPSVEAARARLTPETRAIVLVTPNNPTGAEYPAELVAAFYALAKEAGVGLVVDETYRDFHSQDGPPHDLFTREDWRDRLIHLYSFSKTFRLTGHRVGAMIASPERLAEAEKFLDTVTICPPQLGQIAALEGLRMLEDWVAGERAKILTRRARFASEAERLPDGWRLIAVGAYFAFLEHPVDASSNAVAKALVHTQSVLCLPGTMFAPTVAEGGDGWAERTLRIAFANVDGAGIAATIDRLAAFRL